MTQYIKKLPSVFQTTTQKKFFDATVDQVFSKKDSDLLYGFLGQRIPGKYNPVADFYLPEPTKNRTWWQLEPTAFARNADTTKTNVFFYDDLLNKINYYGGNTLNQDRLFESEYYSWAPPIDYDMFTNYQNYYWVEQGLVSIDISGVMASDIIGKSEFNTSSILGATPQNLALTTGMKITLLDDPENNLPLTVENVGCRPYGNGGIRLVAQFPDYVSGTILEFLPWDGVIELANGRVIRNTNWDTLTWDVQPQPGNADYITIERGAVDRNAWSRTNKWIHIAAINSTISATNTSFPENATRALRPIIQFSADLILFDSGTQFSSEISYGFLNSLFGIPLLLSEFNGQTVDFINNALDIQIENNSLVIFANDVQANKTIYKALISAATQIVTFVEHKQIVDGDIIFAILDAPFNGMQRGETWYFDTASWSRAFNDKTSVNQAPLFQLYDHNGVPLDDATEYPSSTFYGNKIFSYKENLSPGASVDPVLKFPIVYTSLGQASDIVFQNKLITDRYTFDVNALPIEGYYYYSFTGNPVLGNSWNMYSPADCSTSSKVSTSKQRVIDKFVVGYGSEFQFKLSVLPHGYVQNVTPGDLIVSVNGVEVSITSDNIEKINQSYYVNLEEYLTSLLSTTQSQAPVVELSTYTHAVLDPLSTGYFQIPQQLDANPLQQEVAEISASNLTEQFTSIIENQTVFTGTAFGGNNNYRDSLKNNTVGSYILQNVSPALKSMLVSSADDIDLIKSIRFNQDEYTKFKNKFLRTAELLINQEFSPVQYHNNTVTVSAWVDEILNTVNVSKEFSDAFAYSYMIANGTPYLTESLIVPSSGIIQLESYLDLTDYSNALYIYDTTGTERLLTIGVDYSVLSANLSIELQFNDIHAGANIYVALYKNPLPAYIPSTPAKIGAYATYLPRIELDTSYASASVNQVINGITTPMTSFPFVVIGHDGSKVMAYSTYDVNGNIIVQDYRDQLLLELETRIYNLIQTKFRTDYALPLRVESVKSGYFRNTRYSREEFLNITESYINKWSAKNKANYRINEWDSISAITDENDLWKLYNYSSAVTPGGVKLGLPGNWKGIYQYYYDTCYPDTRPWEMQGFSQQPAWWSSQYGSTTTPSNTLLWSDIESGIIRQGSTAIYDPVTLEPQPQSIWARPGIISNNLIPVDASGKRRPILDIYNPSNGLFDIAYSGTPTEPFDGYDNDWIYGDGGPVEQAWMSTSTYPFSVQEFMFLMRPAAYAELVWDTIGTSRSTGTINVDNVSGPVQSSVNWQYVQTDSASSTEPLYAWTRPKNSTQYVHAERYDNELQIRFGYQRWISDRILFLGKDVGDTLGQKIRTLDVNLANKLAGFTNKDTTTTYIESVSTGATTTSLSIPSNNFDVLLHKGQPVKTYTYSGVVIRALSNGMFAVYGYDLLNSEFNVLERSDAQSIDITIGGTPAEFRVYSAGDTYYPGDITRYNGVYYASTTTQLVGKFDIASWQKLRVLPTIGGISVTYRPISETTSIRVPYGSILRTAQEVFDLLIGHGAYLETQGWKFDEISADTNQVSDWLYSAKQFLYWLNTDWAADASIQLSPAANSASLVVAEGYPDDVETISNGVYSILDKYGVAIAPRSTSTEREGSSITVAPADLSSGGIYFLQVNASETEHILIFDNSTSFSDVIYDPLLRARQQRLRFNGFRSNGWYGKMEAPGYLIIGNQMVPNYDTIVESMRYFYDPDVTIDNPSLESLGRHLIGFESKEYLNNMQVSDDVQYLFYQGAIRQKGTVQAFDKLFKSSKIRTSESIEVYEEWALKLADFGNTVEQVSTEFVLKPEQSTGEVIVARLNFIPSQIGIVKHISVVNAENTYKSVPKIIVSEPDAAPVGWVPFSPEKSYSAESVVRIDFLPGNPEYYTAINDVSPGEFNLSEWKSILKTRKARAYAVLNSAGVISRIDITDSGYGYLSAPYVQVDSANELHQLDKFYALWQGVVTRDVTMDNILEIDIDDTDQWVSRPTDSAYSLEFPTTEIIDYATPNAGYVHFDDVTWASFDTIQTAVNWGTVALNPVEDDTVWVAKTFTEDWDVYKLVSISPSTSWKVIVDPAGSLLLLTDIGVTIPEQLSAISANRTDFGNMICLQTLNITSPEPVANYAIAISPAGLYTETDTLTTYNSYSLLTLDGIPITEEDIGEYEDFTDLLLFKTMRWHYAPAGDLPTYTTVGDTLWIDDIAGKWSVTKISSVPAYTAINALDNEIASAWLLLNSSSHGWNPSAPMYYSPHRVQEKLIDTTLYEAAQVFNTATQLRMVSLPVYDPFKNILPALVTQNVSYMQMQDPAKYNVTGEIRLFSDNITFGEDQVGKLWWDTSSVRYVYYEQPLAISTVQNSIILSITHEANTATVITSSPHKLSSNNIINVYDSAPVTYNGEFSITVIDEFSFSYTLNSIPVTDALTVGNYTVGAETATDNLTYRRDRWAQTFPGSSINVYEWVKSNVVPDMYTGTGTPRSTTDYVQLTTSDKFTSATVTNYYFWVLNSTDKPDSGNRTMAAVEVSRLISSPKSQGFAFYSPIQQTAINNSYMFYNLQDIIAYQNSNVQIQYRMSKREDQEHAQWQFFREGDTASFVTDQFWDKMTDSLCGYTRLLPASDEWSNSIFIAQDLPWDIYGWDIAAWDTAAEETSAIYGEILPVPDPALSVPEKYGVKYRPRQGMFVDLAAARKVFVQAGNELLQYIPIRDNNPSWNTGVSNDTYWEYTDWYEVGYESAQPTNVFIDLNAAQSALVAGDLATGNIVEVINGTADGRYVLYAVVEISTTSTTQSFKKVGVELSAVQLSSKLYTDVNVYALSVELRELLNALRTEIFIKNLIVNQNSLYFSMLNYVLSEQKTPDWLFKTSYIYIKEANLPLSADAVYIPDQVENIISYIADTKPYHTQVRDYIQSHTVTDIAYGITSDVMQSKTTLSFGPANGGPYIGRPWDVEYDGLVTSPDQWDSISWDSWPNNYGHILRSGDVEQWVSMAEFDESYTVDITVPNPSKVGLSALYPYDLDISQLMQNDPQLIIVPTDIVSIKVATAGITDSILVYGQDYFVERDSDSAYTVFFFVDPMPSSTTTVTALILWDAGAILNFKFNPARTEVAHGFSKDVFSIKVNTGLPVVNPRPYPTLSDSLNPYVDGWDQAPWENIDNPISGLLQTAGGSSNILWDGSLPDDNIVHSSQTGTTVTIQTSVPHCIPTGSTTYYAVITIPGLPDISGRYMVTPISTTTFTYIVDTAAEFDSGIVGVYYILLSAELEFTEVIDDSVPEFYANNSYSTLLTTSDNIPVIGGYTSTVHPNWYYSADDDAIALDRLYATAESVSVIGNRVIVSTGTVNTSGSLLSGSYHGLVTGFRINTQSNSSEYNVLDRQITVLNAWTFTYALDVAPVSIIPTELTCTVVNAYSSVGVRTMPPGGLWYSRTPQAMYLKSVANTN